MKLNVAKEEMALLMPQALNYSLAQPDSLARAEAAAAASRHASSGAVARAWSSLTGFVRRRAVLNELAQLSDRELADVGLARHELNRVFDPAFARAKTVRRIEATGVPLGRAA